MNLQLLSIDKKQLYWDNVYITKNYTKLGGEITKHLRQLLVQEDILVIPGVYDALTAKIAAQAGYQALVMGGYSIAASRLGQPDVGYLGMSEMLEAVKTIVDAAGLPLVADGDTGYGNALSVRRTVEQYEKAGAAAVIFEDQVWPKRCGHMQGKAVIPAAEHIQKLKAALDARVNKDMLIVARTDARSVLGLEEAIERGHMYLETGVDALFIESPQSEAELEKIGKEFPRTILIANMIEGGRTPTLPADRLKELGYKIVFWPCTALYTIVQSLTEVFTELRKTGSTASCARSIISFEEFNKFIGLPYYQELEKKYTTKGKD